MDYYMYLVSQLGLKWAQLRVNLSLLNMVVPQRKVGIASSTDFVLRKYIQGHRQD